MVFSNIYRWFIPRERTMFAHIDMRCAPLYWRRWCNILLMTPSRPLHCHHRCLKAMLRLIEEKTSWAKMLHLCRGVWSSWPDSASHFGLMSFITLVRSEFVCPHMTQSLSFTEIILKADIYASIQWWQIHLIYPLNSATHKFCSAWNINFYRQRYRK